MTSFNFFEKPWNCLSKFVTSAISIYDFFDELEKREKVFWTFLLSYIEEVHTYLDELDHMYSTRKLLLLCWISIPTHWKMQLEFVNIILVEH